MSENADTAASLPVRFVVTMKGRMELHAAECGHRIPRGSDVQLSADTKDNVRSTYDNAVEYGCPQTVMPCLAKLVGRPLSKRTLQHNDGT